MERLISPGFEMQIEWEELPEMQQNCHDELSLEEILELEVFPEVGKIAQFARLAYIERDDILNFLDGSHPDLKETMRSTFEDWTLIGTGRIEKVSYVGAAFYRHGNSTRHSQLIIAHRGSEDLKDWESNIDGVVKNQVTGHMVSACIFAHTVATQVMKILGKEEHLQIIVTGHSLGGWLAQISTLTLKYIQLPEVGYEDLFKWTRLLTARCHPHCVAFDSPGAKQMLNQLNKFHEIPGNTSTSKMNLDITNYVIQTNLINSLNEHAFDLIRIAKKDFRIQPPSSFSSATDKISNVVYTNEVHKIQLFLELLDSKLESNQDSYGNTHELETYRITNWPVTEYSSGFINNVVKKSRGILRQFLLLIRTPLNMLRLGSLNSYAKQLEGQNAGCGEGIPEKNPSLNRESLDSREELLLENLLKLNGFLINVDSDSERVMPILFKEFSSLMDLNSRKVKLTVEEGRLKFTEKNDILYFRNIALIDNAIIDENLFKWAIESEKFYTEFWKRHGSPNFSSYVSLPEKYLTCASEQIDILILNLVSNIQHNDAAKEYQRLIMMHIQNEAKIMYIANIPKNWHCILDSREIEIPENIPEGVTCLKTDEHNPYPHDFILDCGTIERIMNSEINIDDKPTTLCELGVDSEKLMLFMKRQPEVLLKILNGEMVFGPFSKSIFDSDFVYMQIGERFSETELAMHYRECPSTPPSYNVFAGKSLKLKSVLEKLFSPASYTIVENTNSSFESFKAICKCKKDHVVDLWEFDGINFIHAYQYNPDFYVDRFIQRPVVDDFEFCDNIKKLQKNIKLSCTETSFVEPILSRKQQGLSLTENVLQFHEAEGITLSVSLPNIKELSFKLDPVNLKLDIVKRNEEKLQFHYGLSLPIPDIEAIIGKKKGLILSDEPGMGKSTAVLKYLPGLRETCKLLTFIELKSFELENSDLSNGEKFMEWFIQNVSNNLKLDNFSQFLLLEVVTRCASGEILMVFDGYDEIKGTSQQVFLECLKQLRQIPSIRIIVSTRPHHRKELELVLDTRAYSFVPIEDKDRAKFLAQNWSQILRTESDALMTFADEVISTVHLPLVRLREEFLGVPLQLRILTEIFLKPLKDYLALFYGSNQHEIRADHIKHLIEKDWTLAKIYDTYIQRRLTIYLTEKLSYNSDYDQLLGILYNTINPPLIILAGKFVFDESDSQVNLLWDWFREVVSIIFGRHNVKLVMEFVPLLMKTGLLHGNLEKPDFLHKTFAEYYIAKCLMGVVLLENLSLPSCPSPPELKDNLIKILFSRYILGSSGNVIRSFFNAMLEEKAEIIQKILSFELSGFAACYDKDTLGYLIFQKSYETTFLTFCINCWSDTHLITFLNEIEFNPLMLAMRINYATTEGLFVVLRKLFKCEVPRNMPMFVDIYTKSRKFSMNTLFKIQEWLKTEETGTGVKPFDSETRDVFVSRRPLLSAFLLLEGDHLVDIFRDGTFSEYLIAIRDHVFTNDLRIGRDINTMFKRKLLQYGYNIGSCWCCDGRTFFKEELKHIQNHCLAEWSDFELQKVHYGF